MITALPTRHLLWIVATFLLFGAVAVLGWPFYQGGKAAVMQLIEDKRLALLPQIVGAASLIAALLGSHLVINILWKCFPFLNYVIGPNLNGHFVLRTTSNWTIKQAMLDSLAGTVRVQRDVSQIPTLSIEGALHVKMGLWRIRMDYVTGPHPGASSDSKVHSASLHLDERRGEYELEYVFEGTPRQPTARTDSDRYFGAARLTIPREYRAPNKVSGMFWTNRSWRAGLNTAGLMELERQP